MPAPKDLQQYTDIPAGFESQHRSAVSQGMSRRDALKCLGLIAAGGSALIGDSIATPAFAFNDDKNAGHWPDLALKPVSARGYGKDPNLIVAPQAPWPLIMSPEEYAMTASLCEIIVPREGDIPSAKELNVSDVINEWISAPYPWQQSDRALMMPLLTWLNDEANMRFNSKFMSITSAQQLSIIDNIAYLNENIGAQFMRPARAFARWRSLILAAFFTTAEGMKDIGYMGNVPINGDYPGPSAEAYAHLDDVLDDLGLSEYKYEL